MGFFDKSELNAVAGITQFPTIDVTILKKGSKLVVFYPNYLLGKQGNASQATVSKFLSLDNEAKLITLIDHHCVESDLTGTKVEIKEIVYPSAVGYNTLIEVPLDLLGRLPQEVFHGNPTNIIFVRKGMLPQTKKLNIILAPFESKNAPPGLEQGFKEKYNVDLSQFDSVYVVQSIYPGIFAPPRTDGSFWTRHAILKEIQ